MCSASPRLSTGGSNSTRTVSRSPAVPVPCGCPASTGSTLPRRPTAPGSSPNSLNETCPPAPQRPQRVWLQVVPGRTRCGHAARAALLAVLRRPRTHPHLVCGHVRLQHRLVHARGLEQRAPEAPPEAPARGLPTLALRARRRGVCHAVVAPQQGVVGQRPRRLPLPRGLQLLQERVHSLAIGVRHVDAAVCWCACSCGGVCGLRASPRSWWLALLGRRMPRSCARPAALRSVAHHAPVPSTSCSTCCTMARQPCVGCGSCGTPAAAAAATAAGVSDAGAAVACGSGRAGRVVDGRRVGAHTPHGGVAWCAATCAMVLHNHGVKGPGTTASVWTSTVVARRSLLGVARAHATVPPSLLTLS
jgi:hypothetical protein